MAGKGNNYQQVIAAALGSIERTGSLPQSLSSLSAATGLSSGEIRKSFDSVETLRTGLIDHGITLLADAMGQSVARASPNDPKAQLCALGRAFFDWGDRNRALFGILASALNDPRIAEGSILDMHRKSIRELVERKLRECQNRGLLPSHVSMDLVTANIHSMILGISSMLIYNRADPWYGGEVTDIRVLANQMVDLYMDQVIVDRI